MKAYEDLVSRRVMAMVVYLVLKLVQAKAKVRVKEISGRLLHQES
jgi:hypothetical protein